MVVQDSVSGFTVDSTVGLAQIFLDSSRSNDLVVCSNPSDTALNLGTNNLVIGCEQVIATGSPDPANTPFRPNLPKGKPALH